MKETERHTIHRKAELGQKYSNLNDLLKQISEINSRISDLNAEISKLTTKKNQVEETFNKEVIKVEPTEVCVVGKKKPGIDKEQQDKLIEAAKKDPAILEQVCKLLGVDYVVV